VAVLKTGRNAHLLVSHGGQKQVIVGGDSGLMAAVHDGEQWRRYNRNGSTTRMPNWSDDDALMHGDKRADQDRKRAVKSELDAVRAKWNDRR